VIDYYSIIYIRHKLFKNFQYSSELNIKLYNALLNVILKVYLNINWTIWPTES